MPLFYFDIRTKDQWVADEVGTSLKDVDEAHAEAEELALDLARNALTGRGDKAIVVAVRGDDGAVLLTATIDLKVDKV